MHLATLDPHQVQSAPASIALGVPAPALKIRVPATNGGIHVQESNIQAFARLSGWHEPRRSQGGPKGP